MGSRQKSFGNLNLGLGMLAPKDEGAKDREKRNEDALKNVFDLYVEENVRQENKDFKVRYRDRVTQNQVYIVMQAAGSRLLEREITKYCQESEVKQLIAMGFLSKEDYANKEIITIDVDYDDGEGEVEVDVLHCDHAKQKAMEEHSAAFRLGDPKATPPIPPGPDGNEPSGVTQPFLYTWSDIKQLAAQEPFLSESWRKEQERNTKLSKEIVSNPFQQFFVSVQLLTQSCGEAGNLGCAALENVLTNVGEEFAGKEQKIFEDMLDLVKQPAKRPFQTSLFLSKYAELCKIMGINGIDDASREVITSAEMREGKLKKARQSMRRSIVMNSFRQSHAPPPVKKEEDD